jgi:hypothetical protein
MLARRGDVLRPLRRPGAFWIALGGVSTIRQGPFPLPLFLAGHIRLVAASDTRSSSIPFRCRRRTSLGGCRPLDLAADLRDHVGHDGQGLRCLEHQQEISERKVK